MATISETSSVTLCTGEKPGDGCNGEFPRKDFSGLCARCLMLEGVANDISEFNRRSEYPQCLECGAAARNFKGDQCGRSEEESGQRDQTLVEADRAFGFAFQEKMRAGKMKKKALAASAASAWVTPVPVVATSWRDLTSAAPSLRLSTSNLNHLRDTAKGRLGRMVDVNIVSNIDGESTIWIPDVTAIFHAETPVADIIQDALDIINETWEARSSSSLVRHDIFVLWHKNQNLLPGSLDGTIGELYDQHKADYNAKAYFEGVPQKWRHLKGKSVSFNFESRTKTSAPCVRGKRAADDDGGKVIDYAVKRTRTSVNSTGTVQPVSSDIGRKILPHSSGLRSHVSSTTKISLHVASVTVGVLDGRVAIEWDNSNKCEAVLDDEPCAAGKTKKVYRIMLGGKAYVAKRFIEIGNGRDVVSIDENTAQLINEMTRLAEGRYFLTKFYERAEETGTQVSADFMFSDGLLAQEIVGDCALTPSPASGVPMSVFLDATSGNPDSAITWLLEPLRAASVNRWSGTLEHPIHADKAGKTIDAFMHFAYIYSQQSLVFADLQSTRGRAPSGSGASILFDAMTHTLSQYVN
ncbi:hypothetical protein B0H13DRAFT_2289105 [Mycena leptocephala]|nr:hypothetical protein B0H13DRAFT_2289105 [Mycena leptocephala]